MPTLRQFSRDPVFFNDSSYSHGKKDGNKEKKRKGGIKLFLGTFQ